MACASGLYDLSRALGEQVRTQPVATQVWGTNPSLSEWKVIKNITPAPATRTGLANECSQGLAAHFEGSNETS